MPIPKIEWPAHWDKDAGWPTANSGNLSCGRTWLAANAHLHKNGSSLRLLQERLGREPRPPIPEPHFYTEKLLEDAGRAFHAQRGRWPSPTDGLIDGTPRTWRGAQAWLHRRETSLHAFFVKLGKPPGHRLSLGYIREAVIECRARTGKWPVKKAAISPDDPRTWEAASGHLRNHHQMSLTQFLQGLAAELGLHPPQAIGRPKKGL